MRYAIVIERAGGHYSASVPDLPGCVATGVTITEVKQAIAEAIRVHVAGLREDGEPVPPPTSTVDPQQERPAVDAEDPFVSFTEWAGEADEAAYADL